MADSLILFELDSATVWIRDVAIDPGGDVWAIGSTAPFVHRYSADGRLVQRFGREGRGPGELRSPWAVMPTGAPEAAVEVYDLSQRAVIAYDAQERETTRWPIASTGPVVPAFEVNTFGQMRWLERTGDGYLFFDQPMGVIASRGIRLSVLLRLGARGRVVDTLADLRAGQEPVTVSSRPLELVEIPTAAVCPAGDVLLLESDPPVLLRFDSDGALVARDSLLLPTRPLTEADIRPTLTRLLGWSTRQFGTGPPRDMTLEDAVTQYLREQPDWFGDRTPPAAGLLCDPEGRAWIAEFSTVDDPTGRGRRWRVFDGSRLVQTVVFPPRFRPFVITEESVVGVITDDLDQQRVARAVLPR